MLNVVSSAGVMSVVSWVSFSPSATDPLVPEPVSGLLVVMPVMVPPPVPVTGKIWPGAKVIRPLGAMENPVAAGAAPFSPNSSARLPVGEAVSLPAACACQAKVCAFAAFDVLENELAPISNSGEFEAAVEVAQFNGLSEMFPYDEIPPAGLASPSRPLPLMVNKEVTGLVPFW